MAPLKSNSTATGSKHVHKNSNSKSSNNSNLHDKPKRPLSAYNHFFKEQRQLLLLHLPVRPQGPPKRRGHGKMGFATMAKTIASQWNALQPHDKLPYQAMARQESLRYKREMAEWKQQTKWHKKQQQSQSHEPQKTTLSDEPHATAQLAAPTLAALANLPFLPLLQPQAPQSANSNSNTDAFPMTCVSLSSYWYGDSMTTTSTTTTSSLTGDDDEPQPNNTTNSNDNGFDSYWVQEPALISPVTSSSLCSSHMALGHPDSSLQQLAERLQPEGVDLLVHLFSP